MTSHLVGYGELPILKPSIGGTMILIYALFACQPPKPICDTMCDEHYLHLFTSELEHYTLEVSFTRADGTSDSIELV